jgi:tRNA nucleotidyltransferase (CCA-adding enzyme)
VYEQLRLGDQPAPALTTRLRAELKYILQAHYWKPALKLLAKLNALSCLHQDLLLTTSLEWEIHCVSKWLSYFEPKFSQHWLIRLEILIAHLKLTDRIAVAHKLQLPKESVQRLQQLEILETEVTAKLNKLTNCNSPSQIYQTLYPHKILGLTLFAARSNKNIRRLIWQYVTNFSQVKPLLNGQDLKILGFKPGPLYKQILDDVLAATLDGKVGDRPTAKEYVKAKYQSPNISRDK